MDEDLLQKALQLHQSGDLEKAEAAYLDIVLDDPNNADVLKLLGVLSCQLSKFEEGVNYLEAAVELKGNVAEYHQALGHAYLVSGKVEDGIASLNKAGDLDPTRADVYGALGDTFQNIGDFPQALRAYQRAVVIEPDNVNYKVCAGLCAVFTEQYDAAEEYLEQALADADTLPQIYYGLALVKSARDDKVAAAELMSKAQALDPQNPEYKRLREEFAAA
jgi:tetratricopeptide (TPR) repeat protein